MKITIQSIFCLLALVVNYQVSAQRPKAIIKTPLTGKTYTGGELIPYLGEGRDENNNIIPKENYRWQIIMNHGIGQNQHWHDGIFLIDGVDSGIFEAPTYDDHVLSDSIFFRVIFVVTHPTSKEKDSMKVDIIPLQSKLTLDSEPSGIKLNVPGYGNLTTPINASPTQNMLFVVTAIKKQEINGETYEFKQWSNGNKELTIAFTVPDKDSKITAQYTNLNSIEKRISTQNFKLAPNPANESIELSSSSLSSGGTYQILSYQGIQLTKEISIDNIKELNRIDISTLQNGLYFLRVSTQEGYSYLPFSKQ